MRVGHRPATHARSVAGLYAAPTPTLNGQEAS